MGDGVLGLVLVARNVPEEEPSLVEALTRRLRPGRGSFS